MTLTVVIILSFSVWGGWRRSGMAGQRSADDTAFTIYGKDYSHLELQRFNKYQQLYYMLGMYDLLDLGSVAEGLKSRDPGAANYDFVGNLLVLRAQALDYGIAVSDDEAQKKLESLPRFQKDGKYDQATAANIEKNLGAYGFTGDDLLQVGKDSIAYEKLQAAVGANYSPSPLAVTKSYASKQQTIKASTIQFVLEDFKKKAEVKDDELSKYYDQNKDNYKTPEKRAAAIVLFEKPKPRDEDKPKPDDKAPADEKAKAEKAKADEKKKADDAKDFAEATTKFEALASDFDIEFKKPGADINKLVADFNKRRTDLKLKVEIPGLKVETLPLFERGTPPAQIKDESKLVDEIFRHSLKAGSNGEPVESPKGYYFCKITQVEEPKQQELKDVKDKIKEVLVAQKGQEAMTKAANEARTAINDALKAGKKLDDVLKDKSLKAEALPEFSADNPPPNNPQGQAIAKAAAETPAGGVAKSANVIANDKGELLVVVNAKELRKRDDAETLKKSEEASLASTGSRDLFKSWFGNLRRSANLTVPMN
ncbi:MAG: SurA N-terminal protein [Verrucomicrobiaceae bacterium]|nr:SurA N-terminal protein [Verrucomicrobiaceae bacterium]